MTTRSWLHTLVSPHIEIILHSWLFHEIEGIASGHYDTILASLDLCRLLLSRRHIILVACLLARSISIFVLIFILLALSKSALLHAVDFSAQSLVLITRVRLRVIVLVPTWVIIGRLNAEDHSAPLVNDPLCNILDSGHIGSVLRVSPDNLEQSWVRLKLVLVDSESVYHAKHFRNDFNIGVGAIW